jgi:hypothetical protein
MVRKYNASLIKRLTDSSVLKTQMHTQSHVMSHRQQVNTARDKFILFNKKVHFQYVFRVCIMENVLKVLLLLKKNPMPTMPCKRMTYRIAE